MLGNSGTSSKGYTIVGSSSNTLTLNNSTSAATITVTDGTHEIDAAVMLDDDLDVNGSGGSTWQLSFGSLSSIAGAHALVLNAAHGKLILSGDDTYGGGTTVEDGELVVTSNISLPAHTNLVIGAGGTLIFDPTQAMAGPMSLSQVAAGPGAVPEPGALALLLAGLVVGLAAWWRRKGTRAKLP